MTNQELADVLGHIVVILRELRAAVNPQGESVGIIQNSFSALTQHIYTLRTGIRE